MNIDFNFWLLFLTVASFIIMVVDWLFFEKKRKAKYKDQLAGLSKKEKHKLLKAPFLADYARSLFMVFLIVFLLRAFVIENFRIPTGSMYPTLKTNAFVLVNKFSYGIRSPFTNKTWIETGEPKRGDVVVFHYPVNPNVDFIKRVIGVPGDKISYQNRRLTINGKEIPETLLERLIEPINSLTQKSNKYQEDLLGVKHDILTMPFKSSLSFKDLVVPKGMYFMMGDNRDNSEDSRYWGFVPEKDLVGKAFFVWLSFDDSSYSIRWSQLGWIN
ncbi:signal peptidase I [Thiotrichales bacterium 19S3-7]|nr:signal peptidase I [Thiotrichales bacterium 19S3-7]MCF6801545.1 signal peptidase I [Thiotrichales bacterium 19S3-11]